MGGGAMIWYSVVGIIPRFRYNCIFYNIKSHEFKLCQNVCNKSVLSVSLLVVLECKLAYCFFKPTNYS